MIIWQVIRDRLLIGQFWTPGAAHQFMVDTKHADEASGLDPMSKFEITEVEIVNTNEDGYNA